MHSHSWMYLPQDELYRECDRLLSNHPAALPRTCFHLDSPPYLMATEQPWEGLADCMPAGKSVLTIAGSGDVPLLFLHLNACPVVAVDISRPACFFNELKTAAIMSLHWSDFLAFFLAGIPRAQDFLAGRGVPASLPGSRRLDLYLSVRGNLSGSAASFWDSLLLNGMQRPSPFAHFMRTLDLLSLDSIPFLADEKTYAAWCASATRYPLVNLPLEIALDDADIRFDVVYLSNVLEYMKMRYAAEDDAGGHHAFLDGFLGKASNALNPGGILLFYLFESSASQTFPETLSDFASLEKLGMRCSTRDILYRPSSSCGSSFRHCLLSFTSR